MLVSVCSRPTVPSRHPSYIVTERTKGRPLASGRVSVFAAVVYLIVQYIAGVILYLPYQGVAFWTAIAQLLPLYVC
jgi:4-hydroxybenzoate polyprenyltransferase